jgi:hypothetical protein
MLAVELTAPGGGPDGPPRLRKGPGLMPSTFNRESGSTLNSMTTGGKSYYYLTDAIG